MKPVQELPAEAARQLRFVLCDIDDTLTNEGRLSASAYAALERLQSSGYKVIPVTGRPAGWCDLIARQWPVDAVVGENGAFYFRYDDAARRMHRRFWHDAGARRRHRATLESLGQHIIREVPGAAIAADQLYRESDLAIDYCEDVPALGRKAVRRIVEMFQQAGAQARISSIHVNGWFGDNNKATMSGMLLSEVFDHDMESAPETLLFVGDSPNDCPMFAAVGCAVGVANITEFADELAPGPQWLTSARGGEGFAELAAHLIAAKGCAGS